MKFTYWSGSKKDLEEALKIREESIIEFAESLGFDTSKMKVTYNYKDQSNKTKELKKKMVDLSAYKRAVEQSAERGDIVEYSNGTVTIRLNDKIIDKKIRSKLANIPMNADDAIEYAADIEMNIVADYIAYQSVCNSKEYSIMEKEHLDGVMIAPLLPLFIASVLKLKTREMYESVREVNDPYMYESVQEMSEADWIDLFNICNYHRIRTGLNFSEVSEQVYGANHINSKINALIEQLEQLYKVYETLIEQEDRAV